MSKAKIYGKVKTGHAMGRSAAERMWQRRLQKQRNREATTPKPVAGQIVKEKEGQA